MVYLGTFICISSEIKVGDREVDHSNDIADCIYWMTGNFLSVGRRTSFKTNMILEWLQQFFESY